MKKTVATVVFLLTFPFIAQAGIVDLEIIKEIESSGNPNAVGSSGEIGLYQISPIVRIEYNRFLSQDVSEADLFDPLINEKIAEWFLNVRIPQMIRHYRGEAALTLKNVIISYNAGIRYVKDMEQPPAITINYLKKYNRIKGGQHVSTNR